MYTLQIEHGIKDFDMWKAAFDRDPLDRAGSGVQQFRVSRPAEDSGVVVVELDFETFEKAEDMLGRLQSTVWNSTERAPALIGDPKTRIMETVYTGSY
ncbi:hypothetical protein [Paenarthrobacter nitroguajacolicus]|jgi:hypothetical protein|uniref:hypothetical protein n=1 Tax=Paenarthrobacter nitroguajacolicus TaxID=211146 RepID=UPI000B1C52B7|nr:hypothetical protein [Paenarthrobacter nitroguajacolicus]NWL12772.1 hypothetical protein [Paenarthrobacter nitroguajacolicus]